MSLKTAAVRLDGTGLRFEARTGSGHTILLDDGDGDAGPRPAELVPVAIAACTAMDVISILRKKRQSVARYEVTATGEQAEDVSPHVFTRIDVVHVIDGPSIDVAAVRRAIELSATRYCSVGGTLATGVTEVHHGYVVRSGGRELSDEVVVTGPHQALVGLERRAVVLGAA
ncbi:MAG: OsmC family protein [Candidatus Limnocylindrales bacterium]